MASKTRKRPLPPHEVVAALMERVPGRFSTELGLALAPHRPKTLFLWFLASILYGARISGAIVAHTYAEFVRRGLVTPEQILSTGWDGLVEALDAGGYARYDFKTATKLLEVMRALVDQYQGDLNELHHAARDARDLESRLKALGKGVGDVTVQVFLRELRGIWPKADPPLSPLAMLAASDLGLLDEKVGGAGQSPVARVKALWQRVGIREKRFSDFESALVRLGRDYCRRQRWQSCPMREFCSGRRRGGLRGKGTIHSGIGFTS